MDGCTLNALHSVWRKRTNQNIIQRKTHTRLSCTYDTSYLNNVHGHTITHTHASATCDWLSATHICSIDRPYLFYHMQRRAQAREADGLTVFAKLFQVKIETKTKWQTSTNGNEIQSNSHTTHTYYAIRHSSQTHTAYFGVSRISDKHEGNSFASVRSAPINRKFYAEPDRKGERREMRATIAKTKRDAIEL